MIALVIYFCFVIPAANFNMKPKTLVSMEFTWKFVRFWITPIPDKYPWKLKLQVKICYWDHKTPKYYHWNYKHNDTEFIKGFAQSIISTTYDSFLSKKMKSIYLSFHSCRCMMAQKFSLELNIVLLPPQMVIIGVEACVEN